MGSTAHFWDRLLCESIEAHMSANPRYRHVKVDECINGKLYFLRPVRIPIWRAIWREPTERAEDNVEIAHAAHLTDAIAHRNAMPMAEIDDNASDAGSDLTCNTIESDEELEKANVPEENEIMVPHPMYQPELHEEWLRQQRKDHKPC